jgi:thiol-disulfide isomerase/thioredoxin
MLRPIPFAFALVLFAATVMGAEAERMAIPFDGQADAPEFPAGMEWLNTKSPLTLKDLKGKVVLLDFWTYCCINCMHIIPDLKKLEAKYKNELVVIGVHSAKFQNEKQTDNIREAIQRYEIEHPVVNDKDFKIWRSYQIHSWPSLMLINPNGRIIGAHSGEGIYDLFDEVIGQTVKHFDAKGQIDRRVIHFDLEMNTAPPSLLAFPGKIHGAGDRIVFSDSNHNRIVLAKTSGEILEVIGSGERGLDDGALDKAKFFRPQGVFLDAAADRIFVADTENHSIRLVDLKARTVKTLAGNGKQGRRSETDGTTMVALNSPWDIVLVGDTLYIAMAGQHQLWSLDTKSSEAKLYAGTGYENIKDGPLFGASLAQPSGITSDGKKLYFADSEVSAVRAVGLGENGQVETLIGEGLFEFGDVDGTYPKARLQHPLGVTWHDGFVYVADTYNHKIKKLDPAKKELTSLIGTGTRGYNDGAAEKAQLNEPSGLCVLGDKMFIADANNHLIRVYDFKTKAVSTLAWKNMEKLARPEPPTELALEKLPTQKVSTQAKTITLNLKLPEGKKLNPLARSAMTLESDSPAIKPAEKEIEVKTAAVSIPVALQEGQGILKANLDLYYCDEKNSGLCYFKTKRIAIPIEVKSDGSAVAELTCNVGEK